MNVRTGLVALVAAIVFLCALGTHAATPLPPAPVTGWCYDSFTTPNYNGVRACTNVTPPPGNDPAAMTSAIVLWKSDHGGQRGVDPRATSEVLGRQGPSDAPRAWPYVATTVEVPMPAGKHWRGRISPTTLHAQDYPRLVTNSYLTHPDPGRLWRFAIVRVGATIDQPIVPQAAVRNRLLNDSTIFTFSLDGSPNNYRVPLVPGQDVEILAEPEDGRAGTVCLTWYP